MIDDHALRHVYDRERLLASRLNDFLHEGLGLPAKDYYSSLDEHAFSGLKSVLSDINNIFTLKVCLGFAQWLSTALELSDSEREKIENSVLRNSPNANGYDLEISEPRKIIAEVKCNVPINRGAKYGSAQRNGITKDIESLLHGKSKSKMIPDDDCLKFMVMLDTPQIREATDHFVKNLKQFQERIVFASPDIRPDDPDKIYVVYVNLADNLG